MHCKQLVTFVGYIRFLFIFSCRLEAYDRNNIFGVEEELEDDIPVFPALENFRDVNASTILPPLSNFHIQEFADR